MVCGAVSFSGPGLLLGIPAIILGSIALRRGDGGRNLSLAGIITGCISTLLSLLLLAAAIWLIASGEQPQFMPDNSQPYESSQI